MPKPLTPDDLAAISARTIGHYDDHADSFRLGTWDHDVAQNRDALLASIAGRPPFRILDLGCGPGRDLVAFRDLGHAPTGLDGSARFVAMARAASGCEVLHQDFLALALPAAHFHGVFANASLFHVPSQELPRVLGELHATLVPHGILFSSNPRGDGSEAFTSERYSAFHSFETWRSYVTSAGFTELDHYYRPPGRPRAQQPWLATLWRKT